MGIQRQYPTNLATELSSFVGREAALSEIARAFADGARLVTISGAPGTGKTRVARRCGATHAATVGSVWFCDLTAARSCADIVAAVGAALDVPLTLGATEADSVAQLGRVLAARGDVLLILDNFEQVVAHASATIGIWLENAPNALFLVTSREVLGIEGEVRVELLPLEESDAAELFIARARQTGRRIDLTDEDRKTISEIVARLDGIPLAIELAASRASMLSLTHLRDRLAQRLEWLKSDRRDLNQRHTTLRGAIAWSWSLLDEDEKSALCQCAAFRRSFSLEAAESIVRLSAGRTAVIDALQSLRNKSLLRTEESRGELRFDLYETIRDYALGELESAGRDHEIHARHAAFYLQRGTIWAKGAHGPNGSTDRARLALERDNLIAAHEYFLENDLASAVELLLVLEPLFSTRGPLETFLRLVDQALDVAEKPGDPRSQACLLRVRADIERQRGRAPRAQRDLEKALLLARDAKDRALEGEVLGLLGVVRWTFRAIEEAEPCTRAALEIHRELKNRRLEGMCLGQLGLIAGFREQRDEARALLTEARSIEREEGDRHYEGIVAQFLANTIFEQGDLERARHAYDEALSVLREAENRRYEGITLFSLGLLEIERGHVEESLEFFQRSQRILREVGDERLEGVLETGFGHYAFAHRAFDDAIAHYEEGARLMQQLGGDPRYEGLAVAYAGASAACLDRIEDASVAIASARALILKIGDTNAAAVLDVLDGFVELALARKACANSDDETAEKHVVEATRRAQLTEGKTSLVRAAARFLQREVEANVRAVAKPSSDPKFPGLEIGPNPEWFRRANGDRVDLARRPKLRLLLEALVEKRLESPGDPTHADFLMTRVWPGERILPESAASRLYVAIATLRKLGLHDVLVTRAEGYLLHPAISMRVI